MGAKDNFAQAFKELLLGTDKDEGNQPPVSEYDSAAQNPSEAADPPAVSAPPPPSGGFSFNPPPPPSATPPPRDMGVPSADTTTTIASGTLVIGEIHSTGNMNLFGEVKGNVQTSGDVNLSGRVMGNVAGNDVALSGSAIKGNLSAQGNLSIDSQSVVLGDLRAQGGEVNGHVKGNLLMEGMLHFLGGAIFMGNVSVGSIMIEQGARIRGEICTGSKEDFEIRDPFQNA